VTSTRAVLLVNRMYANRAVVGAIGKYLRYIHYRDPIQRGEVGNGLPGLVRYVVYRDQTSSDNRLFIHRRTVGDVERRALVRFVRRSMEGVPPEVLERKFSGVLAAYRFVLSPEDARGLDLRRLTRQVMHQLERDAGGLPPWIAAEHRNSAHPHTHVVMAARREVAPGKFRRVEITRVRLARMKAVLSREIELERTERQPGVQLRPLSDPHGRTPHERTRHLSRPEEPLIDRRQLARNDPFRWGQRRPRRHRSRGVDWHPMQAAFARLAAHYRRELEREARRLRRSGREAGDEHEWEMYE